METSTNPYVPAIEALETDMADLERQWNALLSAVNVLRGKAGLPPRDPSGSGLSVGNGADAAAGHSKRGSTQVQPDAFHKKTMGAAAREYLEMRKSPATPREIFEALRAGGYQFGSKDDTNAMVILRALLRKSSQMFERLPNNGTYGLKRWYPAGAGKPTAAKATQVSTAKTDAKPETPEAAIGGAAAEAKEATAAA